MSNDIISNLEEITFEGLKDQNARRILVSFLAIEKNATYHTDELLLIPLTKGRSGAGLYKFSLGDDEYVLRMFSPLNTYKDREREAYISRIAGENEVAPKVYYVDPELEGIILEFLPGRTLLKKDLQRSEDIISFALFLRKVHAIPMEKYEATSPLQRGDEWLKIAIEKNKSFPSQFEAVSKKIDAVKKVLPRISTKQVLIHNDLMPPNIMLNGSSFKLIDWPEAGRGDAFWDLTTFSDFNNLNDEEVALFLKGYLGREVSEKEKDLFIIMRPVSTFLRSIGGFAFVKESYSTEFYDQKLQEGNLPSFTKMIDDFSLDQLTLPLWQITLICFIETMRQVNDPKFDKALQRLSSH